MAIIKCPECGHQISDKAPTCPSCGVEIAGKVIRCPECGEIYFKEEDLCPHCHRPTRGQTIMNTPVEQEKETVAPPPIAPVMTEAKADVPVTKVAPPAPPTPPKPKKKSKAAIIVSFVIALLIFGTCYYMYNQAQENRENEEFNIAMRSTEPLILQGYLDKTDLPRRIRMLLVAVRYREEYLHRRKAPLLTHTGRA